MNSRHRAFGPGYAAEQVTHGKGLSIVVPGAYSKGCCSSAFTAM